MDDISNRTLAIFLVTAIIISLGATVTMLNRISPGYAGRATTGAGNVSLQVSSTVSILMRNNTIDFGSGFINDSCVITGPINNATLVAGQVYSDTNGSDCWTGSTSPTAIHIENDGNNNILLKVLGPSNASFFQNGTVYFGTNPYLINFRARNYEATACDANGVLQATWLDFAGTNRTICNNFTFAPTRDEVAIDVMVIIPRDLPSGTYQNQSITFMAATS